ncbi:Ribosomal protein L3 [Elusimicrobium minutum Pei191]|uniref:Large ribosomal subunit protein uL3 n=1 Tax=Elusimicrobium minutum (strain Pei191) TaxID=445932 RepID=B2KEM1_ELUMP|nr:50S ribosomal protein L3 [Elusimicrobium minutum]ACC98967.1 Ribosomal protein L3 [Elusimicrobium minutum Pei191]
MTENTQNAANAAVETQANAETVKETPATFRFVLGEKMGMTQLFDEKGNLHAVSVVKAGPCKVVRVRTQEKDGYTAVCLGFGEVKEKALNKPELGFFKKTTQAPVRHMKEHRVSDVTGFEVGQVVSLDKIFKPGDYVDVQGKIKGRGFAGAMKRHGFAGQPASHGASDRERAPGGLASRRSLGKVLSGQRMAGHYGNTTQTVAKIEVIKVDSENNLIFLKGSVPGAKGTIVSVLETSKTRKHIVAPIVQKISASKAANKK